MTTKYEIPDLASLQESANRIEGAVLDRIRQNPSKRRKVSIAAGLGLFAVGVAVGAAAVPHLANPDYGTTTGPDGRVIPAQLFIACFDSETAKAPVTTLTDGTAAAQRDRANPATFCDTQSRNTALTQALAAEAHRLQIDGQTCGYIQIAGGNKWNWEYDVTNGALGLSDGQPADWPTRCDTTSNLSIPAGTSSSTAVCALADNWAGVYPLATGTPTQLCGRLGYTVWPG